MRQWRKITWALLLWTVFWFVLILFSNVIVAVGLFILWFMGAVLLLAAWFATDPRRRKV